MENSHYFRGYARIPLEALSFKYSLEVLGHRPELKKNVTRVLGLFKTFGCKRDAEKHAVCALVGSQALSEALGEAQDQQLPRDINAALPLPPLLDIPRVKCLNGLHRIRAAENFFLVDDERWWTVKLYSGKRHLP
jgi:hypothetical protein